MREQPHYSELLTLDFFNENYVNKRMSYPAIRNMLLEKGYNIHVGTLCNYAKKLGIGRTCSESKINRLDKPLDYKISYLSENVIEAIDGFLLGDGGIRISGNGNSNIARLSCGVEYEDFCRYMMNYFNIYGAKVNKYKSSNMNQGFVWSGRTYSHPDLYSQYMRWYPFVKEKGKRDKQPPDDVRITPISVIVWYLGDG